MYKKHRWFLALGILAIAACENVTIAPQGSSASASASSGGNGGNGNNNGGGNGSTIDSVVASPSSLSLLAANGSGATCVGTSQQLGVSVWSGGQTITPDSVVYVSGNANVATVTTNGTVSGRGNGQTSVRIVAWKGSSSASRDVPVTVTLCTPGNGNVSVTISPATDSGAVNTTRNLVATVTNASSSGYWQSSNPSIVSVTSSNGTSAVITHVSPGVASVCFVLSNGAAQGCGAYTTLSPQGKVISISVTPINSVQNCANANPVVTFTLAVTVVADQGVSQAVRWSTFDTDIGTVDANTGKVTLIPGKTGTFTLTAATVADPTKAASASIPIVATNCGGSGGLTSLAISPPSGVLLVGQTLPLTAIPTPAGAVTSVSWSITSATPGCAILPGAADLMHNVVQGQLAGCSVVVTITGPGNITATGIYTIIAGTVTCSVAPADGTNFHKGVPTSGSASCTSPTGKVYKPFWASSVPTTLSVNGSDGVVSIGGVNFPYGTTATFNPLNLGDVLVSVQPDIADGAPADKVIMHYHVIP